MKKSPTGKVPAKNPEDVVARDIGREKFSGHTAKKGEGTHGGSIHRHTGAKVRRGRAPMGGASTGILGLRWGLQLFV